jgi:hypothetical protein
MHCRKTALAAIPALLLPAVAWLCSGGSPDVSTRLAPPPSPYATKGVTYQDITAAAGLTRFRHEAGDPLKPYLPETTGSGVALFDYDNDGWVDIYFVNAMSQAARLGRAAPRGSALFRNNHDGTFTDVTSKAGVANNRWGTGVCVGDYDNDGREDLFVANLGLSRLYHNNGDGTFSDVADKSGVIVNTWATGCAFGDYDGDGLLDLYVAGYVDFDWNNPPPAGESSEALRAPAAGNKAAASPGMTGAAYDPGQPFCSYLGMRVACGPLGLKGARDFLFHNNGDGTFTEVSRKAGVFDEKLYYGFSVAWVDLDDDGRLDLVVANDSNPNYVYHNRGDGTFEEIGILCGLGANANGRAQAYMGMGVGDYDHDGRNDFFFTTFSNDNYTVHHNNGKLDFTDVSQSVGLGLVTIPFLGWGAEFLDYDNDGWLDILAANGHVYPQMDRASQFTSYEQRTQLFRNLHSNKFVDVSGNLGAGMTRPKASRGAAVADLFNAGSLDIVLSNMDSAPTMLRNRGANRAGHWIGLKLEGDPARKTPRDAIGSVVFCTAGGFRQRAEIASGRGYISQSDLRIHFGLGSVDHVDKLEVLWANGGRDTVTIPNVDRFYTIVQGKGIR